MACSPRGFSIRKSPPSASCSSWLTRAPTAARGRAWSCAQVRCAISPRPCAPVRSSGSRRRRWPAPAPRSAPARCRAACASARILGAERDPVVGLGHHRRLAGDRIAQHGEAVARADHEGVEAVEVVERALQRLLQAVALAHAPGQIARPPPRCRSRSGSARRGARASRAAGCGSTASRCARGRCPSPVEKGCAPAIVTARLGRHAGVADGVRAAARRRARAARRSASGSPTPLKISIDCPWLSTVASGTLSISHLRAAPPSPAVLKIAWSSISSTVTLAPTASAEPLGDLRPVDARRRAPRRRSW